MSKQILSVSQEILTAVEDGSANWFILDGETIQGFYRNRDQARKAKSTGAVGALVKAADLELVLLQEAPVALATEDEEVLHESSVDRPCKMVWHIADELKVSRPNAKRAEILAECVKRGIAYFTARTQYQQWLSIQKEMAEREAQQKTSAAK